jgi:hypothetical protein
MRIPTTPVTHCGAADLPARSSIPARAGQSSVEIHGKSELTPIAAIKLRPPVFAAARRRRAAQRHHGRISLSVHSPRRRPPPPLRNNIIPGRRAAPHRRRIRPAPAPPGAAAIQELQVLSNRIPQHPGSAPGNPLPPPAPRAAHASAARRRHRTHAFHAASARPRAAEKFIPRPAKPPHPAPARTTAAIAPPAPGVNVGLTVNRDDHVTKIPVVFVPHPAQSGE